MPQILEFSLQDYPLLTKCLLWTAVHLLKCKMFLRVLREGLVCYLKGLACQIGAVGVSAGICFSGSLFGLIASSFEVISQRCWVGCVGGRLVCVCELINLRCVFVGMCIRGDRVGRLLGGGGRLCGA